MLTSTAWSRPSRRLLQSTAGDLKPSRGSDADETARRFWDVAISMLGLVIFSPLFALIALLIKLESPGPVFFTQKRVGKGDRLFDIIKFRSMTVPEAQE